MSIKKNIVIPGKHKKPILMDVFSNNTNKKDPIIIFCHGYKGFKDWGAWDLMAKAFVNAGFCFVKFNFSHNGGTIEQPIDFPDLEAFGNNNYSKELDDLEVVLDALFENTALAQTGDLTNITLMGHSRGGGIVLIKAEEDSRVRNVITLASVCDFGKRSSTIGDLEQWQKDGVKYVVNGRTKQQMPHYYQFYLDYIQNENRLSIKRAVSNLKIPHLIIHGDADTSISVEEAKSLRQWNAKSQLEFVNEANHVFGASHPWISNELPEHLNKIVNKSIFFLRST